MPDSANPGQASVSQEEGIAIEVVYATPERQWLQRLTVPQGTTLGEAVALSDVARECPEADLSDNNFGVFSRKQKPDYVLKPGDRIEVYRPLIADPKEVRRQQAELAKAQAAQKQSGQEPEG